MVTADQLTSYATTAQVATQLVPYATSAQVSNQLAGYTTPAQVTTQLAPYQLSSGSGASLTTLNASALTTGTLPVARIAAASLPLATLDTDPLARANHTGAQAWSTLTATPTTLAGYGITDAVQVRNDGKVGIGTTTPTEKLEVNGNIKLSGQIITPNGVLNLPTSTGTFLTNTASGDFSTAIGGWTTASGMNSTAMGVANSAGGMCSTAMGISTTANGMYSTAMGAVTTANGMYSTAMGCYTTAQTMCSVVLGQYNVLQGDAWQWVPTDDLFVIGNGTDADNPSNAFVVKKNGDTIVSGAATVQGPTTLQGDVTVKTVLRLPPSGDLGMGAFTAGTNPAN